MIRAGELGQYITIEEKIVSENEYGEEEIIYLAENYERTQDIEDWDFGDLNVIEYQNLDGSETDITKVEGETDGELSNYDTKQNDDDKWCIVIEDDEGVTEGQKVTVTYNQKPYDNCWANIQNLKGREYWDSKATNSEVTSKIKIRYRDDITTDMRVEYEGRYFYVDSFFDPYEERKELLLMCKEQL